MTSDEGNHEDSSIELSTVSVRVRRCWVPCWGVVYDYKMKKSNKMSILFNAFAGA